MKLATNIYYVSWDCWNGFRSYRSKVKVMNLMASYTFWWCRIEAYSNLHSVNIDSRLKSHSRILILHHSLGNVAVKHVVHELLQNYASSINCFHSHSTSYSSNDWLTASINTLVDAIIVVTRWTGHFIVQMCFVLVWQLAVLSEILELNFT